MIFTTLLLAAALQAAAAPTLPTHTEPLRNTFVVAVESVVDTAASIKPGTARDASDAQIDNLRTMVANLTTMAAGSADAREKDAVDTANDLVFAVTACQLQSRQGASTDTCQQQVQRARNRVMQSILKHKSGDTWVDGAPAA